MRDETVCPGRSRCCCCVSPWVSMYVHAVKEWTNHKTKRTQSETEVVRKERMLMASHPPFSLHTDKAPLAEASTHRAGGSWKTGRPWPFKPHHCNPTLVSMIPGFSESEMRKGRVDDTFGELPVCQFGMLLFECSGGLLKKVSIDLGKRIQTFLRHRGFVKPNAAKWSSPPLLDCKRTQTESPPPPRKGMQWCGLKGCVCIRGVLVACYVGAMGHWGENTERRG